MLDAEQYHSLSNLPVTTQPSPASTAQHSIAQLSSVELKGNILLYLEHGQSSVTYKGIPMGTQPLVC